MVVLPAVGLLILALLIALCTLMKHSSKVNRKYLIAQERMPRSDTEAAVPEGTATSL